MVARKPSRGTSYNSCPEGSPSVKNAIECTRKSSEPQSLPTTLEHVLHLLLAYQRREA